MVGDQKGPSLIGNVLDTLELDSPIRFKQKHGELLNLSRIGWTITIGINVVDGEGELLIGLFLLLIAFDALMNGHTNFLVPSTSVRLFSIGELG